MSKDVLLVSSPFPAWVPRLTLLEAGHYCDTYPEDISGYQLIIPMSYPAMRRVIGHQPNSKHFVCESETTMDTLDNKHLFILFMHKQAWQQWIPSVYYASSSAGPSIDNMSQLTFPTIFKLPVVSGSRQSQVYKSGPINIQAYDQRHGYILQAYICASLEYIGNFSVVKGHIIDQLYYRTLVPQDNYIARPGVKSLERCVSEDMQEQTDIFAKIFRVLNYTGFACADFRIASDGVIKIFEINPRLGGSFTKNTRDLDQMLRTTLLYVNHSRLYIHGS